MGGAFDPPTQVTISYIIEGTDSDHTHQQSPDATPQGQDSNGNGSTDSTGSDSARASTPSETLRKVRVPMISLRKLHVHVASNNLLII